MEVLTALEEAKSSARSVEEGQSIDVFFGNGLSETQLLQVEDRIGAPLPSDYRILAATCGRIDGPLEGISFTGLDGGQEIEEAMPHSIHFTFDGYGNSWYVDCRTSREEEARISFACHDAPVVLFQCLGMASFLRELIRLHQPPYRSLIDDVHEDRLFDVWSTNPDVISRAQALRSPDPAIQAFIRELDHRFNIVDLRDVAPGMGFSWARYGVRTELKRFGDERIFAYAPPVKKVGFLAKLLGRGLS